MMTRNRLRRSPSYSPHLVRRTVLRKSERSWKDLRLTWKQKIYIYKHTLTQFLFLIKMDECETQRQRDRYLFHKWLRCRNQNTVNAKAIQTIIKNWNISCDDAWYKSPEHIWGAGRLLPVSHDIGPDGSVIRARWHTLKTQLYIICILSDVESYPSSHSWTRGYNRDCNKKDSLLLCILL